MTQSRFVALRPQHVASSRLTWRVARALLSREQGWSLDALSVSRLWRFQVGRSRWVARAYISFFFHAWALRRRGTAVFSINFEGTGSASALESSPLVQELRRRLGTFHGSGKRLEWSIPNESRPWRLLAEMDRTSQAFGTNDRHRAPSSRSRTPSKRLAVIADAVIAHATWNLEGPHLWLWPEVGVCGSISPMPTSYRGRPELSSMLSIPAGKAAGIVTTPAARAESHGHVDHGGKVHSDLTWTKLQPLSLRAALAEARFIETAVSDARRRRG